MLDPHADLGRRAWLPCPSCGTNPVYLLDCDINLIWVQCGTCLRRGWFDTGVGHPRSSDYLFDVALTHRHSLDVDPGRSSAPFEHPLEPGTSRCRSADSAHLGWRCPSWLPLPSLCR
jgi:hypothetical protein